MSFLPKPGEIIEEDDLYDLSGDEDNRLRQEYEWVIVLRMPSRWNFVSGEAHLRVWHVRQDQIPIPILRPINRLIIGLIPPC